MPVINSQVERYYEPKVPLALRGESDHIKTDIILSATAIETRRAAQ